MSTESDPPRLSRDRGASPELSRALGAARARRPSDAVLSEVAARLPMGPTGPGGGPGPGAPGGAPLAPAPVWPGLLVGAALGGVVGALSLLVPVSPPAAVAPAVTLAPVAAAPAPPRDGEDVANREVEEVPAPGPSAGDPPVVRDRDPAPPAAPESEVDYLRRAHAAVASSPAQALALAEAHAQRYPGGKLGQEREVIAIGALLSLGRKAEARARAAAFVRRFPDSAHRRRVEVLVPGLPAP